MPLFTVIFIVSNILVSPDGFSVGSSITAALAGRLEIFPILALLSRSTWRNR